MNNLFTAKKAREIIGKWNGISEFELSNYIINSYKDDDEKLLFYATLRKRSESLDMEMLFNNLLNKAQSVLLNKYSLDKTLELIKEYNPSYYKYLNLRRDRRRNHVKSSTS